MPARYFDKDPRLPPHPLQHVPLALLLRVPNATWIKHASLGPGRFLLSPVTSQWKFYPRQPPTNAIQFDSDNRAYMQLHRHQLPLTNLFAMTHYTLQGQTLPAIILDLARPPGMKFVPCQISIRVCCFSAFLSLSLALRLLSLVRTTIGLRASFCSAASQAWMTF